MILAYAAAIGDTAAGTFDDADSAGFMAPPPFCVSLEWSTVSDSGIYKLLGTSAQENRQTLHLGQDSYFHQPVVSGQRLKIFGTLTSVRTSRSGAITISKLETINERSGEPVVTSWTTALMRGVAVCGEDNSVEDAPADSRESAGEIQTIEIPIAREMPHVYSECSGIWNPIHTERRVALAAGLPDIILHGTASWALAGREITRIYANSDGRRLCRLAGRFAATIIPGTTVMLEHSRSAQNTNTINFKIRNSEGEAAIDGGIAELTEIDDP
jgi:acyl dehydratase